MTSSSSSLPSPVSANSSQSEDDVFGAVWCGRARARMGHARKRRIHGRDMHAARGHPINRERGFQGRRKRSAVPGNARRSWGEGKGGGAEGRGAGGRGARNAGDQRRASSQRFVSEACARVGSRGAGGEEDDMCITHKPTHTNPPLQLVPYPTPLLIEVPSLTLHSFQNGLVHPPPPHAHTSHSLRHGTQYSCQSDTVQMLRALWEPKLFTGDLQ